MNYKLTLCTLLVAILLTYSFNLLPTPTLYSSISSSSSLIHHSPYYLHYLSTKQKLSFEQWTHRFHKTYVNEAERLYRVQIYKQNILIIEQHNILYETGQSLFFKGLNQFTDLTAEEFAARFNWKKDPTLTVTNSCIGSIMDTPNPPQELDWANKVSEVGTQGQCGKDWAMVAASAVQSLYALKIGTLPILSTQQLVECSVDYGNEGCDGGFMDQAFWYIIDNGIATQKSYPDRTPQKCKYVLNMKFTSFSRCARVPQGSYSKLLSAVVQQPVSVAMDQNPDMQFYKGGIYDQKCTSNLNHGMLLVGYGGETAQNYYWKLRNSLGTTWGMGGYMLLKRIQSDGDGKCGIQVWASVPQGLA